MSRRIEGIREERGFIDLKERVTKTPGFTRGGEAVPPAKVDIGKTEEVIKNMIAVTPRVLNQSIPPGTTVRAGTVVNLTLASKELIPFDIFDDVHADLKNQTLNHVDDLIENAKVRDLLVKNESPNSLLAGDRVLLAQEFTKKGIKVDDNDPNRTFAKAFNNVRGAVSFR